MQIHRFNYVDIMVGKTETYNQNANKIKTFHFIIFLKRGQYMLKEYICPPSKTKKELFASCPFVVLYSRINKLHKYVIKPQKVRNKDIVSFYQTEK